MRWSRFFSDLQHLFNAQRRVLDGACTGGNIVRPWMYIYRNVKCVVRNKADGELVLEPCVRIRWERQSTHRRHDIQTGQRFKMPSERNQADERHSNFRPWKPEDPTSSALSWNTSAFRCCGHGGRRAKRRQDFHKLMDALKLFGLSWNRYSWGTECTRCLIYRSSSIRHSIDGLGRVPVSGKLQWDSQEETKHFKRGLESETSPRSNNEMNKNGGLQRVRHSFMFLCLLTFSSAPALCV